MSKPSGRSYKRHLAVQIREKLDDPTTAPEVFAQLSETYAKLLKPGKKRRPGGGQSTQFKTDEHREIDKLLEGVDQEIAAEVRRRASNCPRDRQVFMAHILLLEAQRRQGRANAEERSLRDPNASPLPSYSLVELQEIESQRRQAENDARLAEERATYPKRLEYH